MPSHFDLERRRLLLLALAGTLAGCTRRREASPGALASGALQPEQRQELDALVTQAAAAYGTVGCSVAVLREGALMYERHLGLAARETQTPVSAATQYPIFSISKLFVVVALLQSEARGTLDLDMPVTRIRADLPAAWGNITLRQALSHVSGLPEYLRYPEPPPPTADDAFAAVSRQPLHFPAGTRSEYNQTNFLLARAALERVNGRELTDLVANQFERAAMLHTQYWNAVTPMDALARSYRPAGNPRGADLFEIPRWPSYTYGSTGIITTLGDLVRWTQSLLRGELLPLRTLHDAWRPHRLESGATAWHTNGWEYDSHGDVTIVGHAGDNRVVLRHYFHTADPQRSATVIYLDNGGRTRLIMHRLASLLAQQVLPGAARPTEWLQEELFRSLASRRWDQADRQMEHMARNSSAGDVEAAVNRVGYDALYALDAQSALHPLHWNVARFGNSSNAHDSLGEAYRASGDLPAARASYARALELQPGNTRVIATLAEIDAALLE